MKIVGAEIFPLRIPFRTTFRHAGKTRRDSDSIILKLYSDDGEVGYGEAIARPYVTGESVTACIRHMTDVLWPAVASTTYRYFETGVDTGRALRAIAASLPVHDGRNGVIAWHGARAAFECALIDLLLKRQGRSLSEVLKPRRRVVTYSGVIGLGSLFKTALMVVYFRRLGLSQLKLKIGSRQDMGARLFIVRALAGQQASLRVDGNCAFTTKSAEAVIRQLARSKVICVEQPVPRIAVAELRELQYAASLPIMVDESLVTLDDARRLIEARACRYFNLRLAKNGGIVNTLVLAQLAEKAGVRIQLGCQVGETAVLAAVGRHIAAHLKHVEFIEGSYGPRLLIEDIAHQPVGFGAGGEAPLLNAPGIGVSVNDEIVRKYAQQIVRLPGEGS